MDYPLYSIRGADSRVQLGGTYMYGEWYNMMLKAVDCPIRKVKRCRYM